MSEASGARALPSGAAARASRAAWLPGRARALLFYAAMPALSGVNALVGLMLPLLLGPAQFGRYAIVVTLFQYGLVFDFGLSQLIDRRVPVLAAAADPTALERFVAPVLWLRLYIAGGALALGCGVMAWLDAAGRLPFGYWSGVLSLAAGLSFMVTLGPGSVYRASSRRRLFGQLNIVGMVILAVARPVGMVTGGIFGCFAALAACQVAMAVAVQAQMPLVLARRPGLAAARSLLLQGVPLFLTSFVWAFYMTANRWVVSTMAPELTLGQFAFGANIVTLIVGALGAMSQFYYPKIVSRFAAGAPFAVSRPVRRDFLLLLAGATLVTAVGLRVGPLLIAMLYPKFAGAASGAQIMLLAMPGLVLAAWLMPLALSTAKRPWLEGLLVYPPALIVLMAATHAGYRIAGIDGAAYGLVASALPLLALQLGALRLTRLLGTRDASIIFVATAAATAALWLMLP